MKFRVVEHTPYKVGDITGRQFFYLQGSEADEGVYVNLVISQDEMRTRSLCDLLNSTYNEYFSPVPEVDIIQGVRPTTGVVPEY